MSMHSWRASAGGRGVHPSDQAPPPPIRAVKGPVVPPAPSAGKKVPPPPASTGKKAPQASTAAKKAPPPPPSAGKKAPQAPAPTAAKKVPPAPPADSDEEVRVVVDEEVVVDQIPDRTGLRVSHGRDGEIVNVKATGVDAHEVKGLRPGKLNNMVISFFMRERAACRGENGEYRIGSGWPTLYKFIIEYNVASVMSSSAAWTVNWARLLCQHPQVRKFLEKVQATVSSYTPEEEGPLLIELGTPEAEVFGMVVATFWLCEYAAGTVFDEAEEGQTFTMLTGNLICSSQEIVKRNSCKLRHRLNIINYAATMGPHGGPLWLPETAAEWEAHCGTARTVPVSSPVPIVQSPQIGAVGGAVLGAHPGHASRGGDMGGRGAGVVPRGRGGAPTSPTPGVSWKDKLKNPTVQCSFCHGWGHAQVACTSTNESRQVCWKCHGVGHVKLQCPSPVK